MPLVNSFITEQNLLAYRLCWITGRFGSGKTSVAYMLARTYLEKGYRLISNNRSIWADDLKDIKPLEDGKLKAVIILDEGGLEFKSNKQIEMVAAYAAKMDVMYIIPSYFPPCRAAQVITIAAVFNLKAAGIPVICYKWTIRIANNAFQDKGFFLWYKPKEIYGIYSRTDPGARTGKIVNWIIGQTQEFRRHWGYDDELSEVEEGGGEFDVFADTVQALSEVADGWAALPSRKRGRR